MILFVLPSFAGGGAERVLLNILIQLHHRGANVELIVFNRSGPLIRMLPEDISCHNLNSMSLRNALFPLIRKIKKLKPKVIFSTLSYVNLSLIIIRFLIRQKFLIFAREANLPSISISNNKFPNFMNFLYLRLYQYADKIICSSLRMKNEFIENFKIPEEKLFVLPNAVDEDWIRKMASSKLEIDKGNILFVASGRLVYQKGFERLLKIFNELDNDNLKLYILGDGPMKHDLSRMIKKLNIESKAFLVGFCENPWKWYANADVFLLPSRWEGMSNAALESLSCGTPIIATASSGGISELAKETNIGDVIVVDDEDLFKIEMSAAVKKNINQLPRQSMLPKNYRLDNVVLQIEEWLNE